jgi:hypothetical protein
MSGVRAPDAEAQVAEPGIREIGFHEVEEGGGIEKSAKAIIKANPEAFGLDPDDPKLNTKAGQEAHKLARGLADKYGMTYKDLNEIASHKVQPGDQIRIFQDPLNGKWNLTYNGAAFDNALSPDNIPDVPHGGAGAAQEIAPTKAGMTVDDVKPKASVAPEDATRPRAGAAAEQQPTRARGGGKMNFPPEVEELDRKAQASAARALESQQYADNLREQSVGSEAVYSAATSKAHLATRGLWENVFRDAGFSKRGNVWNRSALEIYGQLKQYIAHDVTSPDPTNENMARLGGLFKAFGKPPVGMSMDDYLRNVDSNSANLPILNTLKSAPFEELTRPLRK